MTTRDGLSTLLHAPREEHEALVRDFVTPLALEFASDPRLRALFFGRHNEPDWHLRVSVVGDPEWVRGPLPVLVERRLAALEATRRLSGHEFAAYEREEARFGGVEGARLAERIFHHDTLACLARIEVESRGEAARSRREYCLLMTERLLDLLRFDRDRRIAFYHHGYSFEIELGRWGPGERDALERHYRSIKDGLLELLRSEPGRDPAFLWGGVAAAAAAESCIEALRPLVGDLLGGLGAGTIRKGAADLAWSLAHMHANRLQIEADAEAILRYFMHRLHEEERIVTA
ncbi:MAG: thiopeptide-type bacteriocin biosynthesis protein [Acidobacteriia bacterium]|nr:thiopeptide-type bacteriocin biosynthesis protein [Terriglobia bacterium]